MVELLHTEYLNDELIEKIKELHKMVHELCDESIDNHIELYNYLYDKNPNVQKLKTQKVVADNLLKDAIDQSEEVLSSIHEEDEKYYHDCDSENHCCCDCEVCEDCDKKDIGNSSK